MYKAGIRKYLEEWISEMIFMEAEEGFVVSREFYRIVKNPIGRRYVTFRDAVPFNRDSISE